MQICLIDCGSSKVPRITQILEAIGRRVETVPLECANVHGFDRYDGLVISGGNHLFTDVGTGKALGELFAFIDTLTIPTLGICLGHQAIALRHGAIPYLGPERRSQETIQRLGEHDLFKDIQFPATFRTDHCEGVPLPTDFRHLATSNAYTVEAMASLSKPLFGVQFHPEVSGQVGELLLHNFCGIVQAVE